MSDEHIDKLLGSDDDKEFAEEIKAYEAEEAKTAEPEPQPEPEVEEPVAEEPEVEASEETEQPDGEEPPAEETKPEPRQVPVSALQAERAKTQALQQEVNQIKLYLQQLQQNVQQPQGEPETVPDPDENPIEALSWLMKNQAKQAELQQQEAQNRQREAQIQQIQQNYARQAQQFEAQAPDFKEAYNHLIANRAQELALAGMPQDQIAQRINDEELNMAAAALQNGMNPAEQIYQMAKLRGYAPKAAAPVPQPTPQERQSMEEARRAASINTNRSAPPAKSMTLEQIADLYGAAFDKALAKWERENGLGPKTII